MWKAIIKTYIKKYMVGSISLYPHKIGDIFEYIICGLLIVLCILYV